MEEVTRVGSRDPSNTDGRVPWSVPLSAAVAYAISTWLTDPVFVADTADMALSAVARVLGANCLFFEPGHLLWRPVGYVALEALGTASPGASIDQVIRASQVQLGWLAWFAGLITIVCGAVWVQRRVGHLAATACGVGVILVSKAFLNYSQVGASYVPALACLMAALVLLSSKDAPAYASFAAGALLGASVLFWGTFALALPAALASPLLFTADTRRAVRPAMLAIAGGAVSAILAAVWVYSSMGFTSVGDLRMWAATADHGITVGGIPRAVLGFARSYLETGDYGELVKRFLLGNPADPVSVRELIGFPLFGILGFYLGLLLVLIIAWRRASRRIVVFFLLNAFPVAVFAIVWQGGDLERYLPLVPGMALLVAAAFAAAPVPQRALVLAWVVMIIVPNALTLGRPAVAADRERLRAFVRELETPERNRLLVFSHWQDERVQFNRNFPPGEAPLGVRFYDLLTVGTSSVRDWKRRAAARILGAWDTGLEVLVSERLVSDAPRREWDWVDGDDARVSWSDFHAYFTRLTYGAPVGVDGDGFLPLPPTVANRAVLVEYRDVSAAATGAGTAPTTGGGGCRLPPTVPALALGATAFLR
jgi:hypothetical protein